MEIREKKMEELLKKNEKGGSETPLKETIK